MVRGGAELRDVDKADNEGNFEIKFDCDYLKVRWGGQFAKGDGVMNGQHYSATSSGSVGTDVEV